MCVVHRNPLMACLAATALPLSHLRRCPNAPALQRDWAVDAAGDVSLTYERFEACLFELADQWTTTVEAEEYLAFLNALKFRLGRM